MSASTATARLEASQDRKREGDVLFGRGSYDQAAAVYRDAGELLDGPACAVPGLRGARCGQAVMECGKGVREARTCRIARDVVALGGCCTRARRVVLTPRGTVLAALRCEPQAEQALLLRGRCLMAMGDYFAAYCDYWELAALKPDALEPQQQMQAIAAVCPEALEEHRAKYDLDGVHGTGLASKFAQSFALSGAGVLAVGWTVLAGLSLFATPPASSSSSTTSSSASAASTWGLRVLVAWGDLFSALSLVAVAVLPIIAVILPWPSTERGTNCMPAPYFTLSRPFAVASCLASRSASAIIWCLLVPLLVSEGNLVATRGGLFGMSGGGVSWVHLLISSTIVHGLITAARIPLQIETVNNVLGRLSAYVELASMAPVMLAECTSVCVCVCVCVCVS